MGLEMPLFPRVIMGWVEGIVVGMVSTRGLVGWVVEEEGTGSVGQTEDGVLGEVEEVLAGGVGEVGDVVGSMGRSRRVGVGVWLVALWVVGAEVGGSVTASEGVGD